MAVFVVSVILWSGTGLLKNHVVGVTKSHELAQELMVMKALHILKLHQKLRDHRFLHFTREFDGEEQEVDLGDIQDHLGVLRALIAHRLSDGNEIFVHHGKRGFAVKIKEVPFYDEEDIHLAPYMWNEKLQEKIEKKRAKLERLENFLEEHERRVSERAVPTSFGAFSRSQMEPQMEPQRPISFGQMSRPVSPPRATSPPRRATSPPSRATLPKVAPVTSVRPESPRRSLAQTLFPFLQ